MVSSEDRSRGRARQEWTRTRVAKKRQRLPVFLNLLFFGYGQQSLMEVISLPPTPGRKQTRNTH